MGTRGALLHLKIKYSLEKKLINNEFKLAKLFSLLEFQTLMMDPRSILMSKL